MRQPWPFEFHTEDFPLQWPDGNGQAQPCLSLLRPWSHGQDNSVTGQRTVIQHDASHTPVRLLEAAHCTSPDGGARALGCLRQEHGKEVTIYHAITIEINAS